MVLLDTIVRIYQSDEPSTAFSVLAEALAEKGLLRAFWSDGDGTLGGHWPEDDPLARELHTGGADARERHQEHLLVLPLPRSGGTLGLHSAPPRETVEPELEPLVQAFDQVLLQHQRLARAEAEQDALRLRAEQSEALHVMGLAANRSLELEEVLQLVARFTRTLLGAHYVTVTTNDDGHLETVAAVGVRSGTGEAGDPLAARVIRAGKPLLLDESVDPGAIRQLPFHRDQGMRAGLGVPLAFLGETVGALVVGYRRPYPLHARDTRLALALAGHAAVAISNARLHLALAARSRELERAYAELRWSAEAKERFFASMSHELRTPLNAILGYQSLLLDGVAGELQPVQHGFVENANRATRNLLRLVNDVLDLSKLEAGKVDLVIRPVDLRDLVREALATMRPLAAAKQVELVAPRIPPLPLIATDAERVQQILLNLLSNAVKFTEEGEVGIYVDFFPEPEPGWAALRVTDTGPGIRREDQERIFHEFEQVVDASSRGGTGLGLPISRKLARLLGGDLQVESEVGRGSTFVLRLPVEHSAEPGISIAEHVKHSTGA